MNNDYGFEKFCNTTLKTLDKYAPRKAKHANGNQIPFMTKDLSKIIRKDYGYATNTLKIIMKKIGNCIPNKEIIASLC